MSLFPMFVKLDGRPCLVVGAGQIGEGKIQGLLAAGAVVDVVAPWGTPVVEEWAKAGLIAWHRRLFQPGDLEGVALVVAATSSTELNAQIFREARLRNVLCNAVDDPGNCDFYYPSVVRRGDLQIAISTAGHSPALAQRLRQELELQYGAEYSLWVEQLGKARQQLFATSMDPEARRRLLHDLASRKAFEDLHRQSGNEASS